MPFISAECAGLFDLWKTIGTNLQKLTWKKQKETLCRYYMDVL